MNFVRENERIKLEFPSKSFYEVVWWRNLRQWSEGTNGGMVGGGDVRMRLRVAKDEDEIAWGWGKGADGLRGGCVLWENWEKMIGLGLGFC